MFKFCYDIFLTTVTKTRFDSGNFYFIFKIRILFDDEIYPRKFTDQSRNLHEKSTFY